MFMERVTAKISLRSSGAKDEWRSAELLAVASSCHALDWRRRFGHNFKIECSHPLATAERFCPELHFQVEFTSLKCQKKMEFFVFTFCRGFRVSIAALL
jgi:hypothetical protein